MVTKQTRIYGASTVLLLIIAVSMIGFIGSMPFASASGSLSQKETDPNGYATSLAGKLIGSFYTTLPNGTMLLNYPVEYGGAYIDHSNHLHIVLSKYSTNATIDTYRSIIGDPDVIYETAEFPLSHLGAVQDALNGVMLDFSIDASGINEITNRLDVNLHDATKRSDVIQFLNSKFTDFNDSCITFLGPVEISDGILHITPSAVPSGNFVLLGSDIPVFYGVAAVAIIAVTVTLACYLAFVRHQAKPQTT